VRGLPEEVARVKQRFKIPDSASVEFALGKAMGQAGREYSGKFSSKSP